MTEIDRKKRRHRNERIAAALIVLIAAAALAATLMYTRRETEQLAHQTTYVPRQLKMTPEAKLLQEYVRIDTSNPPGNELPAAQWLAGMIAKAGVPTEIIEPAPRRANLYVRIKGKRPGEGLLLLHHMDVVPAIGTWTRPPFAAEIYFNQIYGRGTLDMKGTGICELRAFLDVAESGRTPERDIVFLAVADEEAGSALGTKWLIEHRPDIFEGIRYAINEGGITEMMQEKVRYYGIEIGTKQIVTLELEGPSRSQLQQARIALEPWFVSREPQRISPEVKRWMHDLGPQRIAFRDQLLDIDAAAAAGRFWDLPVGYREMTQDNVWADNVEEHGGRWRMRTYLLNLPDTDPDQRIEWLRGKVAPFGVRVGEVLRKEGPVPVTSDQTPFFRLMAAEAARAYGAPVGTEMLNKWFNDSRFLRKRGIAAYGLDPFPIDYFQSETIHSTDERVRVDYFAQGVEFLRRVVMAYAFTEVTQSVRETPQKPSESPSRAASEKR
ncbi:MAG TPA: M20/M25/M40 family metallo-hydrolase [Thermoanaerobaculia bacterium]|nr:M20/M25/M40 family metallo-hydrolase [Thermoanaerobaculia bacterium]